MNVCWTLWNKCYEDTNMKDNIKKITRQFPGVRSNGGDTSWHEQLQLALTKCFGSMREGGKNSCYHSCIIESDHFCLKVPHYPLSAALVSLSYTCLGIYDAWVVSARVFVSIHFRRSYLTLYTSQCMLFRWVLWLLSFCTASSNARLEPHCIPTLCPYFLVPWAQGFTTLINITK